MSEYNATVYSISRFTLDDVQSVNYGFGMSVVANSKCALDKQNL